MPAHLQGCEGIKRGFQSWFALQSRQQRYQAFRQIGREITTIAFAPQHLPRAGKDARIVVAARA